MADGIKTYTVGQAGSVTIEVRNGALILVGVTPNSGWTYVVTKNLPDAIDVHFDKGQSEAEIEVDLDDGQLIVVVS
ncbi:MAG: hypothetical protein OEM39_07795 [Acidimicrobiia bacterium]|nr:hypothetical protein [Acidimicrobiia bacterium]